MRSAHGGALACWRQWDGERAIDQQRAAPLRLRAYASHAARARDREDVLKRAVGARGGERERAEVEP